MRSAMRSLLLLPVFALACSQQDSTSKTSAAPKAPDANLPTVHYYSLGKM